MKIVHSADWHIGKIVNEFSMIDDQEYIIDKLIELLKKVEADVLIISGDIYDRSIPPVEAVELLNRTFNRILIEHNIKILAIAGNHDGKERLGFGGDILEKQGLYIASDNVKKVSLSDDNGPISFYLIPYIEPVVLRKKLDNQEIRTHNDVMEYLINNIKETMSRDERNVIVAHGYVTMHREEAIDIDDDLKYRVAELEISDSERPLSIGGTELIDGSIFSDFDYTALGHLHGRQKVSSDRIRYSGSLLKYSFSEVNHKKGVTIIDIKDKNHTFIEQRELEPKRNMRIIKGPIDDLIKAAQEDKSENNDYIQAILTDKGELIDPIGKLRAVYPNIMLLKIENNKDIGDSKTAAKEGFKSKSELQLFGEFYSTFSDDEFTEEKKNIVTEAIKSVLGSEEV